MSFVKVTACQCPYRGDWSETAMEDTEAYISVSSHERRLLLFVMKQ